MKRYNAAPADLKPFERVVTIFSLLPQDQLKKIPLIEEMRDRILRARAPRLHLRRGLGRAQPEHSRR